MRNDAHDELDDVPSLTTDARDRDTYEAEPKEAARAPAYGRTAAVPASSRGASTGALWALVGALVIALGGLGWWSFQQISLMEQQLVATQESFARISEEAAGRIQDISGKVVATESTVTSGSEALRLQVRQLETKVAELTKQQQAATTQQRSQDGRIEQLTTDLKAQQGDADKFAAPLKTLGTEQAALKSELAALKSAQGGVSELETQLKRLSGEVDALKKIGNPSQAISRLEQDLLVLKGDLETRPAASSNTAEFDAFRAQMSRNISTLQAQVQNLQQQIDGMR